VSRRVAWGDVISGVADWNMEWSLNPDVEELLRYNLEGLRLHCEHPRRHKLVGGDDSYYYWSCRECGLNAKDPAEHPTEAGTLTGHGFEWTAAAEHRERARKR
jgi:hypothetical protein